MTVDIIEKIDVLFIFRCGHVTEKPRPYFNDCVPNLDIICALN